MPQFGQNLTPAAISVPQFVQAVGCAAGVPQFGQNFTPAPMAVPQFVQADADA